MDMRSTIANLRLGFRKGDDMVNAPSSIFKRSIGGIIAVARILPGLVLAVGAATSVLAQGEIPSGTISSSGSGPYTFDLTFGNAASATSPIGSIWYAWIPGQFYLPGTPTSASAPAGWTAAISGNSVQYIANSVANYLTAGSSLSGFSYQANFSPAQLAAAPNSGVSVAYSGGLFADTGNTFTVQAVPEPSETMLLISGGAGLCLACWRKLRAA
jgi:hypothetical protein